MSIKLSVMLFWANRTIVILIYFHCSLWDNFTVLVRSWKVLATTWAIIMLITDLVHGDTNGMVGRTLVTVNHRGRWGSFVVVIWHIFRVWWGLGCLGAVFMSTAWLVISLGTVFVLIADPSVGDTAAGPNAGVFVACSVIINDTNLLYLCLKVDFKK